MRNKSYFVRLIKDFVVILIVPLATIFLLWWTAEQNIREHILLSSENTLNLFFKFIDASMDDARTISYAISEDRKFEQYARNFVNSDKKNGYANYEMCKILAMHVDEKYYDLFVYYPKEKRILSAKNGSLETEYYFQAYYFDKEYNCLDEFEEVLSCGKVRPSLYVMHRGEKTPYLCVAMRKHFIENADKDFVVVQVISPDYLDKIMTVPYSKDGGELLIFNRDEELLISSGDLKDYHMGEHSDIQTLFEDHIDGMKYMIQIKDAKSIDGYYAIATPFRYFWEQLRSICFIYAAGCFACIFFSIIMVYRSSKHTYRPVGEIVEKIGNHDYAMYDSRVESEFDFIEGIFEKNREEKNSLKNSMQRNEKLRSEKFVLSLLDKNVNGKAFDIASLEKNGIELCSSNFMVAILCVENNTELDGNMISFVIDNVFSELHNDKNKIYIAQIDAEKYVVLVNFRNPFRLEEEYEILKEGQRFFEKYCFALTIAVGRVHESISEIHKSYGEALAGLKYQYLYGAGSFLTYDSVADRPFHYLHSADSKVSKLIQSYIKSRDMVMTPEGFLAEILEMYSIDDAVSIETVECFRYELISALGKALVSNNMNDKKDAVIGNLMGQGTFGELKEAASKLLYLLWEKEQENAEEQDICLKAKEFIQKNHQNQQLSVSLIGEELQISSWYISKLFKDKYGISLLDYISETRITAAKELLQTNKNLDEIAEEVGYSGRKAFINNFKKWEGITPGVFRELNCEKG